MCGLSATPLRLDSTRQAAGEEAEFSHPSRLGDLLDFPAGLALGDGLHVSSRRGQA